MKENNSNLSHEDLIKLQTMFRNGLVKEEDLSEDVIKQLEELYHSQIKDLKQSIEQDKQEIIRIRKNMKY